ncbi:MAG: sigma-70 family RNA polymerase sigma factor [Myxococcota bacterium]
MPTPAVFPVTESSAEFAAPIRTWPGSPPIDDRAVQVSMRISQREVFARHIGQDSTGEALLALVECANRFDASRGPALMTYAFGRVRGRALDAVRREVRQWRTRRDFHMHGLVLASAVPQVTISTRLDLGRAIAAVLPELGSAERLVLNGHYGADLSLNQLATQGAASTDQLQRAHRSLIQRLRRKLSVLPEPILPS